MEKHLVLNNNKKMLKIKRMIQCYKDGNKIIKMKNTLKMKKFNFDNIIILKLTKLNNFYYFFFLKSLQIGLYFMNFYFLTYLL